MRNNNVYAVKKSYVYEIRVMNANIEDKKQNYEYSVFAVTKKDAIAYVMDFNLLMRDSIFPHLDIASKTKEFSCYYLNGIRAGIGKPQSFTFFIQRHSSVGALKK